MSHAAPGLFAAPRWSKWGHSGRELPFTVTDVGFGMADRAGLPACVAMVCVGPPLFCNAPSSGFVFCRSPGPDRAQVESVAILRPRLTSVPPDARLHAGAPLPPPAMIVAAVGMLAAMVRRPTPAVFPAIVLP